MSKIKRVWTVLRRDGVKTLIKSVHKYSREKIPYRENSIAAVIYFLLRGSILTSIENIQREITKIILA